MKHISKMELSEVLIEVRKAYRLLYYYQRRVLDTVKFISDLLSLTPAGGYSVYSDNTPKNGAKVQFDKWSWDWLNFYMWEFYYGTRTVGSDYYEFGIQIQSDTGSYDTSADEREVQDFAPPELSQTRILFIYGKNRWKAEKQEGHESFTEFHSLPVLAAGENSHFEVDDSGNRAFVLKAVLLEEFIDELSIKTQVDEFLAFLKNKRLDWVFK